MDNVLVDFRSAFSKVDPALLIKFENDKDEIPGIFAYQSILLVEKSPKRSQCPYYGVNTLLTSLKG